MDTRRPAAFLSYVRSDDDHDAGKITNFRARLEGEVKMQTGRPFAIFQDRNDISWGQEWEQRIRSSLGEVTFLIPVMTPSFFSSPACRGEWETFSLREKTLGLNRLILPLYYVECEELEDTNNKDKIGQTLRSRHWTDWRPFRFRNFAEPDVAKAIAQMATTIREAIKEIEAAGIAAQNSKGFGATIEEASVERTSSKRKYLRSDPPRLAKARPLQRPVPEARSTKAFDLAKFEQTSALPYFAYTRKYDEVISAKDLADSKEILKLYREVTKTATAIQRVYGYELVAAASTFLSETSRPKSWSIALLLDNSGSMRGQSISLASAWILVLAEWLERAAIRTEVLGYTTRAWKGGQSRETWLIDGKHTPGGRLNDLRHIVYKTFEESAREAAPNFGVMLRTGIQKENIDGEALLWAHDRIGNEKVAKKTIIMISDGAPVDDSTLAVNPPDFLQRHLADVGHWMDADTSIELKMVAIGHDASSYCRDVTMIDDAKELGLAILAAIGIVTGTGDAPARKKRQVPTKAV